MRTHIATKIAFALTMLVVGVITLADLIGLVPDEPAIINHHRASVCEMFAIQCAAAATHNDLGGIQDLISAVTEHNPDILSLGVRGDDGKLVAAAGPHARLWPASTADGSIVRIKIPIFLHEKQWGTVEFCFHPAGIGGWLDLYFGAHTRLILFVSAVSMLCIMYVLRRVLTHLDPSTVIPDRVKSLLDTLAEGVLVLDNDNRIVVVNNAFTGATGLGIEMLVGQKIDHIPWKQPQSDAPPPVLPWIEAARLGQTQRGTALMLDSKQTGQHIFSVSASPIKAEGSRARGVLVSLDDVTALHDRNNKLVTMVKELETAQEVVRQQNTQLSIMASKDALTGCFNRRALFDRFSAIWSDASRYRFPLSAVMLDVDHFKSVNDKHGHAVGDQVLQRVAQVLIATAREGDVVCRYGGEEFCVILPHTDLDAAEAAAERLRVSIESQTIGALKVTASFGVATKRPNHAAPEAIMNDADAALYAAKRTGRNKVVRADQMPANLPAPAEKSKAQSPAANKPAENVGAAEKTSSAEKTSTAGTTSTEQNTSTAEKTSINENASASQTASPQMASAIDAASDLSTAIPFPAVTALMSALQHRDLDTAAHCRRVADLCVLLGFDLLDSRDCMVLEVAGLLHDIGKIGVPDAILLKPGALTPEEFEVMDRHSMIGIEIVQSAFKSQELTDIVRTHHAHYGSNPRQPNLPCGQAIPLRARILAIADAFDAITSDRVYRPARSKETAFAELRRCAGTQFDPALVERFIEVVQARSENRRAPGLSDQQERWAHLSAEVERLASALDARDIRAASAVASHLSQTAAKLQMPAIADLAARMHSAASVEQDVSKLVEGINELIGVCRSAQEQILTEADVARAGTIEKV